MANIPESKVREAIYFLRRLQHVAGPTANRLEQIFQTIEGEPLTEGQKDAIVSAYENRLAHIKGAFLRLPLAGDVDAIDPGPYEEE